MPQPPPCPPAPFPTIGVFDSGFGGLTVLRALLDHIPNANYVFLGDSARLPYGSKSQTTVARFAVSSARFLLDQGADLLVIACNTASALALDEIRAAAAPTPVIGVITPGAQAALTAATQQKTVISTEAKRSGETCFSTHTLHPTTPQPNAPPQQKAVISTEAQRSGETCSSLAPPPTSTSVISTEAQQSGEICGLPHPPPTSSSVISTEAQRSGDTCISTHTLHPATPQPNVPPQQKAVISTEAQRSGETCGLLHPPPTSSSVISTEAQRSGETCISILPPEQTATILVLATTATVASGAYTAALADLGLTATEKACPLFVPLVEEGWTDHPVTAEVARIYLAEALAAAPNAHTLLLGCTHYPLIANLLERTAAELGHPLHLVDSAQATALAVLQALGPQPAPTTATPTPNLQLFATDSVEKFQRLGSHFLGRPLPPVHLIDLPE